MLRTLTGILVFSSFVLMAPAPETPVYPPKTAPVQLAQEPFPPICPPICKAAVKPKPTKKKPTDKRLKQTTVA